ncbi:MAG: tetratricopeptide repeat protein, partial [Oscillospiraceae bacterium]|nr:tetratricopeptide repeat protein [Oscillospiraceae bacterium]
MKGCIAEVAAAVVVAAMAAADPSQAPFVTHLAASISFAAIVKEFVKGINIRAGEPGPAEKLAVAMRRQAKTAFAPFRPKASPALLDAVADHLFDLNHAQDYCRTDAPEEALHQAMRMILEDFPGYAALNPHLDGIADQIANGMREEILTDATLRGLDTNVNVHEIIALLREDRQELREVRDHLKALAPPPANQVPRWLTPPGTAQSPHYVDRPELDGLCAALAACGKVLLHGMGGLGKTELMRAACARLAGGYTHCAWVAYTGSLKSSFKNQFLYPDVGTLSDQDAFAEICRALTALGGSVLLMIDNIDANVSQDEDLRRLGQLPCRVIATARPSQLFSSFQDVPVGYLSPEDCEKLFVQYARLQEPYDAPALWAIIARTGRHTLALEIIARAMWKRKKTLPDALRELESKGFNIPIEISTAHSEDMPEAMMRQLEKLYEISDVAGKPTHQYILKNFAVLPYLPLPGNDVTEWMGLDPQQEQALYELCDLGWLELSPAGIAMHSVVRAVARRLEIGMGDCETLIDHLCGVATGDDFRRKAAIRPHMESVASAFNEKSAGYARLCHELSGVLEDMGNLPEALDWQLKDKKIREALYPDGVHPHLAITYNNLALIYHDMGDLPEALTW